jgi:hypothetical protein
MMLLMRSPAPDNPEGVKGLAVVPQRVGLAAVLEGQVEDLEDLRGDLEEGRSEDHLEGRLAVLIMVILMSILMVIILTITHTITILMPSPNPIPNFAPVRVHTSKTIFKMRLSKTRIKEFIPSPLKNHSLRIPPKGIFF